MDEGFLSPKYGAGWIHDAFLLSGMEKAVERILRAREQGEKVVVFGDYDADGITAATLMRDGLEALGVTVAKVVLPDRFEDGYGMNMGVIESATSVGATLIVTVDCGSGNEEVIVAALEAGVETIVTDHHECASPPKSAVAVVNPKHPQSKYANRDLAGVGVVYKLICALASRVKGASGLVKGWEKWLLDLVAIGTVCDSMPLVGENRALVYWGLQVLAKGKRVGLKELARVAGVKKLDAEALGFMIGPRINAAGRLASPYVAYELLNAKTRTDAVKAAVKLNDLNQTRKSVQDGAMREALEFVDADARVIVVQGKWAEGIVGIVAGRLVEMFHRPAFVLTEVEKGILKGSARSFGDFDLSKAIEACRDLLEGGGGHKMAAGLSMKNANLGKFTQAVNEFYDSLKLKNQEKYCEVGVDLEIDDVGELSQKFFEETRLLEPFGEGNPEPVFGLLSVIVTEARKMGNGEKHLALSVLGSDGKSIRLVAFGAPEEWCVERGVRADVKITLSANEWRGVTKIEGRIVGISVI